MLTNHGQDNPADSSRFPDIPPQRRVFHPGIRDAAIEDYLRAAQDRFDHQPERQARRAAGPGAMFLAWLRDGFQYGCRLVERGRRTDVAVLYVLIEFFGLRSYEKVTSFLWAHRWLWVWGRSLAARAGHCADCPHRKPRWGRDYCTAEGGIRGCGCWKTWWWPLAGLVYKRRLRGWPCPLGRWGGGFCAALQRRRRYVPI